jgi:hypothetical protein
VPPEHFATKVDQRASSRNDMTSYLDNEFARIMANGVVVGSRTIEQDESFDAIAAQHDSMRMIQATTQAYFSSRAHSGPGHHRHGTGGFPNENQFLQESLNESGAKTMERQE